MASRRGLDAQIVIIGSGISGIAAAQKLVKYGFGNVRILEATARSGGRIKTGTFGKLDHHTTTTDLPIEHERL